MGRNACCASVCDVESLLMYPRYVQGSAKYRNSAKLKVSLNHTCCERGGWLCGSAWSAQIPGLIVACRTWPVDHALSAPCWGAGQGFMVKDWPGAALALHNAREANARIYLVHDSCSSDSHPSWLGECWNLHKDSMHGYTIASKASINISECVSCVPPLLMPNIAAGSAFWFGHPQCLLHIQSHAN